MRKCQRQSISCVYLYSFGCHIYVESQFLRCAPSPKRKWTMQLAFRSGMSFKTWKSHHFGYYRVIGIWYTCSLDLKFQYCSPHFCGQVLFNVNRHSENVGLVLLRKKEQGNAIAKWAKAEPKPVSSMRAVQTSFRYCACAVCPDNNICKCMDTNTHANCRQSVLHTDEKLAVIITSVWTINVQQLRQ